MKEVKVKTITTPDGKKYEFPNMYDGVIFNETVVVLIVPPEDKEEVLNALKEVE